MIKQLVEQAPKLRKMAGAHWDTVSVFYIIYILNNIWEYFGFSYNDTGEQANTEAFAIEHLNNTAIRLC